ncbi:MAG: hypothetical protein RIM84_17355 [Alphaproteobacteria bacterium]
MKPYGRTLFAGLALVAGLGVAMPATAGGDFFFSFGVGSGYHHRGYHRGHHWRGHHWRGHHYGHHRHHYRPHYRSTVIFAPPPVYYVQPAPPPPPRETCARFNGDATVDGRGTPFHGVACLRGDGRWHIVSGG